MGGGVPPYQLVNIRIVITSKFIPSHTENRSRKMSLYPISIRRCQHIKVNGTQCASPALRNEKVCYFHMRWCIKSTEKNSNGSGEPNLTNNSHAQDPIT